MKGGIVIAFGVWCVFLCAVTRGQALAEGTVTLWASEDAWVNEQNPEASYGANTYVSLKDRSGAAEAWIKFGAQDAQKLRKEQIGDASLWLYQYMGTYSPGDDLSLHLGESGWSENTMNWATKPGYSVDGISSISVQEGEGVWREWKGLGGLLKTWSGGDLCVVLENHLDGKNEEFFGRFYSSEYAVPEFRPQIKVTTTPEPVSALLFLAGAGTLVAVKRRNTKES
jgi:hypothetical protein